MSFGGCPALHASYQGHLGKRTPARGLSDGGLGATSCPSLTVMWGMSSASTGVCRAPHHVLVCSCARQLRLPSATGVAEERGGLNAQNNRADSGTSLMVRIYSDP